MRLAAAERWRLSTKNHVHAAEFSITHFSGTNAGLAKSRTYAPKIAKTSPALFKLSMTTVMRGAMATAPMHAIRASTPATGKSYLVDLCATLATGRPCPVIAVGRSEEETEKRLVARLLEGAPIIALDNVSNFLGGEFLCQLTERPLVNVRILGYSKTPEFECKSMMFVNGNNFFLFGDITRRIVLCNLDAGIERPELRRFDF